LSSLLSWRLALNSALIVFAMKVSVCCGSSLLSASMFILPGCMSFCRSIISSGSVICLMFPWKALASLFFRPYFEYLVSMSVSLHFLRNPVHCAVGSNTITAIFLLSASSIIVWAATDLPEPVAPAMMVCVCSLFRSMYAFIRVSAMLPMCAAFIPDFGSVAYSTRKL